MRVWKRQTIRNSCTAELSSTKDRFGPLLCNIIRFLRKWQDSSSIFLWQGYFWKNQNTACLLNLFWTRVEYLLTSEDRETAVCWSISVSMPIRQFFICRKRKWADIWNVPLLLLLLKVNFETWSPSQWLHAEACLPKTSLPQHPTSTKSYQLKNSGNCI